MYRGHEFIENGHFAIEKAKLAAILYGVGSIHDLYSPNAALSNQIQKYAVKHSRPGLPILIIEEALHGYQLNVIKTPTVRLQAGPAYGTRMDFCELDYYTGIRRKWRLLEEDRRTARIPSGRQQKWCASPRSQLWCRAKIPRSWAKFGTGPI